MQGHDISAVIYAAKSTADSHGSIPDQVERCREYAAAQGWEVVEPPESDEAASAYHGSRGPGLARAKQRAAALAAQGRETVLLVFASDRLARGDGRNAAHLVEHVLDGLKAGYRVESATENLGGDMALVFASLYGERAHADSKAKGQHTKRGINKMVREGRWHGPAPYGYRTAGSKEERRLIVDEAKATIVRRIFNEYLAGTGIARLAHNLTIDGVRPPRSTTWDRHSVANILDQVAYVGKVKVNGEVFDGVHEPLVDEEVWLRAQAQRQARKPNPSRGRPPAGLHLFIGGLLRCGGCGGPMRARTPAGRQPRYDCSSVEGCRMGVLRRDVDEPFMNYLESVVFDVEATREAITEEHARRTAESEALIAQAERDVLEVDAAFSRIKADYMAGKIDATDWQSFRDELAEKREAAEAEAEQLRARADEVTASIEGLDVDAEAAERLAWLRAAVAGEITHTEGIEALRAALGRVFSAVTLVRTDDGLVLVPKVREFSEVAAWVALDSERALVQPLPRRMAVPKERVRKGARSRPGRTRC
jgi:DNA invertase Pin-like site-specific DNA recombinase